MSSLLETIHRAKQLGDMRVLTEVIPYVTWLGISAEVADGELLGKLRFADMLIGNPALPALHGGTLGALLESTAIFQLLWTEETVALPKTITLTVDYLRSGRPVETFAKGVITKRGRRVVNVHVEAWQDDRAKPIATANAHFLIVPAPGS